MLKSNILVFLIKVLVLALILRESIEIQCLAIFYIDFKQEINRF